MNSLKDKVAVSTDAMYVILGASGNTGSIIADSLLSKGKNARVVGRDAGRLQRFVGKGAEAFTANVSDAAALTKAFSGARAAYFDVAAGMKNPGRTRSETAMRSRESREGVRPALRRALEQLRRAGPGRHRASRGAAAFFGAKSCKRDQQV